MSVEDSLVGRLENNVDLAALVDDRIYANLAPQKVSHPYITYQRIGGAPVSSLVADTDIIDSRFQITSFDDTYSGAVAVAKKVREALQRWRGTEAGTVVLDTMIENETDFYESDTKLHQVIIDIEISHRG